MEKNLKTASPRVPAGGAGVTVPAAAGQPLQRQAGPMAGAPAQPLAAGTTTATAMKPVGYAQPAAAADKEQFGEELRRTTTTTGGWERAAAGRGRPAEELGQGRSRCGPRFLCQPASPPACLTCRYLTGSQIFLPPALLCAAAVQPGTTRAPPPVAAAAAARPRR